MARLNNQRVFFQRVIILKCLCLVYCGHENAEMFSGEVHHETMNGNGGVISIICG